MPAPLVLAQENEPIEVSDQTSNEKFTEALENYRPLVGIPGIDADSVTEMGFGDYINALYRLSISIAALLAVIKIIAAGVKYMFSDIVTQKADAKKDIQGALVGLLIIIGAVIILNTVNTDITQNQILLTPTGADGTDPLIIQQLQNSLIGKYNAAAALCDSATDLEECVTVTDLSENECLARDGVFISGSLIQYVAGENALSSGNYYDRCTFLQVMDSIDDNIGIDVDIEDITSSQVTTSSIIESILGLDTGELGETELDLISSYLDNTINRDQFVEILAYSSDTPLPDFESLDSLATELACGASNRGETASYTRLGDQITFVCVDAIP